MIRRRDLLVLSLLALASWNATSGPRSVLDRSTGATLLLSELPWTLALEQPRLAANARDYIELYAVEVNTAGHRRHFLAVFFWSTVLGRSGFAGPAPELTLRVDDRELALRPAAATPREIGISRWPQKAPGHGAELILYEVDTALLRHLAATDRVLARPEGDATLPPDVWFEPWRAGRKAFGEFMAAVFD